MSGDAVNATVRVVDWLRSDSCREVQSAAEMQLPTHCGLHGALRLCPRLGSGGGQTRARYVGLNRRILVTQSRPGTISIYSRARRTTKNRIPLIMEPSAGCLDKETAGLAIAV